MIPRILLVEDDPKTEAGIKETLGGYEVEVVPSVEAARDLIRKKSPDLMIIDFDLKAADGLQIFRELHSLVPKVRAIMISVSGNIPLAVSATKLGVSEFLRKPISAEQLRASVKRNISQVEEVAFGPAEVGWLQGESDELKGFYGDLQKVLAAYRNLLLIGEPGIDKSAVAEFIHAHSLKKNRKLRTLALSSFRRENLETLFWATVQEIMIEPEMGSLQSEEDRCGTLYLENIESLDENFKQSIFGFFRERRGRVDKEILVIIGVYDKDTVRKEMVEGYAEVEIPPLRKRKDDLPSLLGHYLKSYSAKHNKNVKGVEADLLDFLMTHDYPGNYKELEGLIEQGILRSSWQQLLPSELLGLKDIPLDYKGILEFSIKKSIRGGHRSMEEARREFERNLYGALLSKTGGDVAASARFLDIPRTVLAERLEDLSY